MNNSRIDQVKNIPVQHDMGREPYKRPFSRIWWNRDPLNMMWGPVIRDIETRAI